MTTWKIDKPERLTLDDDVKRLDVYLVAGRLNVVGTTGPPRVEIASIGTRELTVRHEDGQLFVGHENVPKWPGLVWWLMHNKFRVDVSVAVPGATPASLHVVAGTVVASTLRAGAKVDVTSGRITMLGLDGDVTAKIVSGPIEALSIGGVLDTETVSGEIVIAESTARRVRARTVSGAITCDLDNPPADSEIKLETISGEITARVREDSDLRVSLNAISGRVTSAFGELTRSGSKSVHGDLGAGTGRLAANATSGNISLLRRPVDYEEGDGR